MSCAHLVIDTCVLQYTAILEIITSAVLIQSTLFNEGLTLEISAFNLSKVANLPYQLS